ncbi:MAG: Crp/Fnr family transcriptional regulator [Bacteroidota bacterium]
MSALTESINQIVRLTQDEISSIEKAYSTIEISKGELFIEQGKVCNQVAFVVSGKLRNFYFDEAGNEVTCFFVTADSFVSAFSSFLTNAPTHENIAALEDTVLRVISKKDLEELSILVPTIQVFRRIIAENLFITMEKRIVMLQSQSAHERYEKMIKENPEILLSVPLQYTASFLGITPQHLSRLRKELAK